MLSIRIVKFYKKTIFLLFFIALRGYAQDIIYKQDGTSIKAKVIEIGSGEIKYKKFDNLEGPNYTLEKKEIILIVYANGTHELISPRISNERDLKKADVADVRYNNADGRNGLSFDLLDIFISNIGITYERYSESGRFGLRIPLSLSLRSGNSTYYSGPFVGANKRYSIATSFNYYPFGQIKNTYFAGINLSFGEYDYDYFNYTNYVSNSYRRSTTLIIGHVLNGYQLRVTPHFNMQFIVGLGLSKNNEVNVQSNVSSSVTFIFNMGYRF